MAKTVLLTENLDFAPESGSIEARNFFRIQTRVRPEPDPKSRGPIDNSGEW